MSVVGRSFDEASPFAASLWDVASNVNTTTGRNGLGCTFPFFNSELQNTSLWGGLTPASLICGFAYNGVFTSPCTLSDPGGTGVKAQVNIHSDGRVTVTTDTFIGGGGVSSFSVASLDVFNWYYFELWATGITITITPVTGITSSVHIAFSAGVNLNGITVASFAVNVTQTVLNSSIPAGLWFTAITFSGLQGAVIDDVYMDSSFHGDVVVTAADALLVPPPPTVTRMTQGGWETGQVKVPPNHFTQQIWEYNKFNVTTARMTQQVWEVVMLRLGGGAPEYIKRRLVGN